MSLTATYTDATAKVTLTVASAPANASSVLLERSIDGGITWTTVRGAQALGLTSGALTVGSFDDNEFIDGVLNTYRATYSDSSGPAYVGTAAAATVTTSAGASASVTPTMPTGLGLGDAVFVAIANTKATAVTPAAPTGWTKLAVDSDGLAVYAADWTSSLTIPAFTVTSLASGDKVIGKAFSMRNVASALGNAQAQVNAASATLIAWPAFSAVAGSAQAGFILGFSRTINTGVTPSVNSNDTATGWTLVNWVVVAASYGSGAFTLSGGSSATSSVLQVNLGLRAFVSQETATVTPALSVAWIKNPLRPYLNRAIQVIEIGDLVNTARSGTFDVIARTMPVAVTDLYSGRKSSLKLRTTSPSVFQDLHDCLMTGDVQFVHAPKGSRTPTGYFVLGDLDESAPANTAATRYLAFPITEVAMPDPSLAPVLSTWQTVLNDYISWSALVTAKATWQAVLQLVGTPTDIITG